MATVTKEKESKIQYLSDIIGYDNEPIISDMSKIPVFKVEGCEVMFSSLGAKLQKQDIQFAYFFQMIIFGHKIRN